MHYTINKSELTALNVTRCYIPGHDLGGGWRRHIVQLDEGDTADNPCSTKGPLYGPGFIVYDCAPTGITVREFDDAAPFYDALRTPQPWELDKAKALVNDDELLNKILDALEIPIPGNGS